MTVRLRNELAAKFPSALSKRCEKGACQLIVDGFKTKPTLLDCDLYCNASGHRGSICDYLIFLEHQGLSVVSVEMKGRSLHARKAVEQLRAGAQVAEVLTKDHEVAKFLPLLLSRSLHASELKVVSKMQVRFRGVDFHVVQKRCGARLWDLLHQLGWTARRVASKRGPTHP